MASYGWLNDMMDLDHVIRVREDGTVDAHPQRTAPLMPHAPESVVFTRHDGQIMAEHEAAWAESVRSQGWEPERGWSGQDRYAGPFMHESEFIGGNLAEHILSTPGLWAAVVVTCLREDPVCEACGDPDEPVVAETDDELPLCAGCADHEREKGEHLTDVDLESHTCDYCENDETESEVAGWAVLHMDDSDQSESFAVTLDPRTITEQASYIRELPRMDLAAAQQLVTNRWIASHPSLGRIVRVTDLAVMPEPVPELAWHKINTDQGFNDQEADTRHAGYYAQIGPDGRPEQPWSWTIVADDGHGTDVASGYAYTEDQAKYAAAHWSPDLEEQIRALEAEQGAAIREHRVEAWERTPACARLDQLREQRGFRPENNRTGETA